MYFPYFQGRQYELIALRELNERNLLGDFVLPIIEPVRLTDTLCSTLESFANKNRPIAVVHNPLESRFLMDLDNKKNEENKLRFLKAQSVIITAHRMNKFSSAQIDDLVSSGINRDEILVINSDSSFLDSFLHEFRNNKFTLVPDNAIFRIRVNGGRVLFDDKFHKKINDSDYQESEDELFSEDHLYYKSEGFVGFFDYSIMGSADRDKGFAPYAVAIHIVYFDKKSMNLRIHHFVSDNKNYYKNTKGKFYDAVSKLADWCDKNEIDHSYGLDVLLEHYEHRSFPGLGAAKQLSIMHHLEIMGKYLVRSEK